MFEVNVAALPIEPFSALVSADRLAALEATADKTRARLGGRAVWNINSAATGGGVAEMLRSLLRYARGLGIQARWLVIDGPPEFFRITKRLHNGIHGSAGDGTPLGPEEAALYERVLADNAIALDALVRQGDVVICHDPQTAGLVPHLLGRGMHVVWRCHIGHEIGGGEVERAWGFLRPYLEKVPVAVFTREEYAPPWLPSARAAVLPPTLDPFSAKNRQMDDNAIGAILAKAGLVGVPSTLPPTFTRDDGSVGRVDRGAEVLRLGAAPDWETPLVVQVSRWDRMKDPLGVLEGFARHVVPHVHRKAHLVLAGPQMLAVADDPEGAQVYCDVESAWRALPEAVRSTIDLAQLPMEDGEENGAIVNALQRHAAIIVQKSTQEGFGLTVTEAMWKRRPVIASAVGGIKDQIDDGVDGLLLGDPNDLAELGRAICRVLDDPTFATSLGDAAHRRIVERSLSISSLENWAALLEMLLAASQSVTAAA